MPTPVSPTTKRHTARTLAWVLPLYFAQGLPYGVVQLMGPVYFTATGASLAAIGLSSLLALPWNLKPLWSPLTDLLGRRRRWVTATLGLLVAAIAALALVSERPWGIADLRAIGTVPLAVLASAGVMAVIALISATADASQDAFYMDALSDRDQAAYIGSRVTAYRVAMLTSSGGLVVLAGWWNWTAAFAVAAVLMGGMWALNRVVLPYPVQSRPRYGSAGEFAAEFARAFLTYVDRRRAAIVLAFVVTYKLGDQMLGKMSAPFLMNDLGLTTAQMGFLSGTLGIAATIVGALAGSAWIARRGLWSSMIAITVAMNATNLLYVLLALADGPGIVAVAGVYLVEHFSGGLGVAALSFFLIRTCSQQFRASHYAIATGLMSLGGTLAGSASGFVAARLGYPSYFALTIALGMPGLLLLFALPRELTGRGDSSAGSPTASGPEASCP